MQFSSAVVAIFGASLAIMPVVFGAPQVLGSCYALCLVEKKGCDTLCSLLGPCDDHCDKLLAACQKDCGVAHAE
ncbi:hypothetical protein HYFRA_00007400 [Hymenoscyphus fraxineus]|uniref:Extracellular membrane protein CFEM domain-containing protein n=1 Tax=Hymenoscyphus fraxineus TaxID=746836 RepID=A0A9N9PGB3_9HELO|nr:hypothetical protein HYFRA_00007400 [Hymenoscyphus fraxineus]